MTSDINTEKAKIELQHELECMSDSALHEILHSALVVRSVQYFVESLPQHDPRRVQVSGVDVFTCLGNKSQDVLYHVRRLNAMPNNIFKEIVLHFSPQTNIDYALTLHAYDIPCSTTCVEKQNVARTSLILDRLSYWMKLKWMKYLAKCVVSHSKQILSYDHGNEVLHMIDNAREILVTHFTSAIPSDNYTDLMIRKIREGTLKVKRITFYNEFLSHEHYCWMRRFRDNEGKLINGYNEYIFKGTPLPFDIAVYDGEKVVLRLPPSPDAEIFTHVILLNDSEVATLFKQVFMTLIDPNNSYIYGHSEPTEEITGYPPGFLVENAQQQPKFQPLKERILLLRGQWEGVACQKLNEGEILHLPDGEVVKIQATKLFQFTTRVILRIRPGTQIKGEATLTLDLDHFDIPNIRGKKVVYTKLQGTFTGNTLRLHTRCGVQQEHTADITLTLTEEGNILHGTWQGHGLLTREMVYGSVVMEKFAEVRPWESQTDNFWSLPQEAPFSGDGERY